VPKVSVIVSTYNRARYIADALESLWNQTYSDFEVIVVDDGSTDNTREIINEYKKKFKNRMTYIYQENKGAFSANNVGLRAARGEYITFLDSDDVYLKDKIAMQVEVLDSGESVDIASCWYDKIDKEGNPIPEKMERFQKDIATQDDVIWKRIAVGPVLMMFRRRCFDEVGYFDESFFNSGDLDLMFRCAAKGMKIRFVKKALMLYRKHDSNISRKVSEKLKNHIRALDKLFSLSYLPKHIREQKIDIYYWYCFNSTWFIYYSGQEVEAGEALLRCLKLKPHLLKDKETFTRWFYNLVEPQNRSQKEVLRYLDKNYDVIHGFLAWCFNKEQLPFDIASLKRRAWINFYLTSGLLFYLKRDLGKARHNYCQAFYLSPLSMFTYNNIITFMKTFLLSLQTICRNGIGYKYAKS